VRKLSFEEITAKRISSEEIGKIERFPIYTALDNIRSLYNVGSIFRTADAVRLEKLYLTGITGHPTRKEINKTALGAVETVPWEYEEELLSLIQKLKSQNIQIVVLEHTSTSIPYFEMQYEFPTCIVLGNEVFGIQDKIVEISDASIDIPMHGTKQSLNVTVAYGIVIYDLLLKYLIQTCR
jgi:tRNA G18 (ribose-2'-O)-methylase SpoU